jgi:hypothetical protein
MSTPHTDAPTLLFCISCDVIQIRSEARSTLILAASAPGCLLPEPSNPYDRYAVAVTSNDAKMGYIPRRIARCLQPMLTDQQISWTVTLRLSEAAAADGIDESDEGQTATADISASALNSCGALPLLRIQADTVVAAAAAKRLSPDELHSKFMRDSLLHLTHVHAVGVCSIVSPTHAELASKLLSLDDYSLGLLSRLMQRRSQWVQASALKLHTSSTALSSLISIGVVATSSQRMAPELALSLLPSLPLPILTKLSRAINAKQAASKRDVLREIMSAACKQRTLFGGPMHLAPAIARCLADVPPFICVLPSVRTLCGRSASLMFLGVAKPPAVITAISSEYDEALSEDVLEGSAGRSSVTHSHAGCLHWFKLLPMIEIGMADRPCDLLADVCTMPPQPITASVLSDVEMTDCDFAKDCLDAAVWFGAKTSASNDLQSRTGCALLILLSCAVRGVREYLHRHGCMSQQCPSAQLLSCVFDFIPPPPPNFPRASSTCYDAYALPSLPKALAAASNAASSATSNSAQSAAVSIEAAAVSLRAFTLLNSSPHSACSPMRLLQALPHMQPHYVSRFSSVYVYCKTLHAICPSLEALGMHAHACIAYVMLLSLPFFRHRRAHWWTRLCINVENARFSRAAPTESLTDDHGEAGYSALLRMCRGCSSAALSDSLLLCALKDDMVHESGLLCLIQRAQRFADASCSSEQSKQSIAAAISRLNLPALLDVPEIIIEGRPSNRAAGQKSHFIGFDDSVGVSVEDLALQWYVQHVWGVTDGVGRSFCYYHVGQAFAGTPWKKMGLGKEFTVKEPCCSAFLVCSCLTSFGLPVPLFGRSVLSTPTLLSIWGETASSEASYHVLVQCTEQFARYIDFYVNRKDAIEQRLLELQCSDHFMLTAAIEKGISKVGQNCRHVSWERLDKEALIALSRGIGSAALANLCRVICKGARRAGLPDLMLWRSVDGMRAHLDV